MYRIVADYLDDQVGIEKLPQDARRQLDAAVKALRAEGCPEGYGCKSEDDGSKRISVPCGVRRMLLGYDVYETQNLIFLNYLKWDRSREVLDWIGGLFGNEPGRKQ